MTSGLSSCEATHCVVLRLCLPVRLQRNKANLKKTFTVSVIRLSDQPYGNANAITVFVATTEIYCFPEISYVIGLDRIGREALY